MYFVDNIHLILAHRRGKNHFIADITNIVHTVVAGRIDFNNIHIFICTGSQAGFTFPAGFPFFEILAVYRSGKQFGRTGLSRTPGTGKQIGMGNPSAFQLIQKRTNDRLLPHKVFKSLRPPPAVKRNVCHKLLQ